VIDPSGSNSTNGIAELSDYSRKIAFAAYSGIGVGNMGGAVEMGYGTEARRPDAVAKNDCKCASLSGATAPLFPATAPLSL
jgi:hypothetical protein